jgi:hypothetical protein
VKPLAERVCGDGGAGVWCLRGLGGLDREEAGRLLDVEGAQKVSLSGAGLGALERPAGGAVELAEVQALELAPGGRPRQVGLDLDHAGEQQSEEAEQHVRANALVFAVIDGAQFEGVLEGAPAAFDLDQLLVAERDLVRKSESSEEESRNLPSTRCVRRRQRPPFPLRTLPGGSRIAGKCHRRLQIMARP